jgi:hypothetical protein
MKGKKMTKQNMINDIHLNKKTGNFYYTEIDFYEGFVGVQPNGDMVRYGKPCYVEIKDKWVKCNLHRLPKKWVEACWSSLITGTFVHPDDMQEQKRVNKEFLFFNGIIDEKGNYI